MCANTPRLRIVLCHLEPSQRSNELEDCFNSVKVMNDSAPFESVRTPPNYMRFWSARHTPTKFSCQSSFHSPTFSCVLSRYYAVCLLSETCQAPRRYRFVFLVFRCCSGKIGLLKCDTRSLLYGIRLLRKMKTAGRVLVCRCCRRVSAQCELER